MSYTDNKNQQAVILDARNDTPIAFPVFPKSGKIGVERLPQRARVVTPGDLLKLPCDAQGLRLVELL